MIACQQLIQNHPETWKQATIHPFLQACQYVKQLEKQADQVLSEADQQTVKQAESAFVKIATLEKDFWQMAYSSS